jgi:hypothetical protein
MLKTFPKETPCAASCVHPLNVSAAGFVSAGVGSDDGIADAGKRNTQPLPVYRGC